MGLLQEICIFAVLSASVLAWDHHIPDTDHCEPWVKNKTVFYERPFTINLQCDMELVKQLGNNSWCIIVDATNGKILLNSTVHPGLEFPEETKLRFDPVTINTSLEYKTIVWPMDKHKNDCYVDLVFLHPTKFETGSCLGNAMTGVERSVEKGASTTMNCVDLAKEDDMEVLNTDSTYYWLYNCGAELPPNTRDTKYGQLEMYDASFEDHPGIYTCVEKYRGVIRYWAPYEVCVKHAQSADIDVKCTDKMAELGKDVTVTCHVDAGLGQTDEFPFTIWVRNQVSTSSEDNVHCSKRGSKESLEESRMSCEYTFTPSGKCYKTPQDQDVKAEPSEFTVVFKIRNVQKSDLGRYGFNVTKYANLGDSTSFDITEDAQPGLQKSTVIVTVVITTVVGITIIALLVTLFFHVEVTWLCRRHFGSYEKGIKAYTAYLAYYYNKEMSDASREDLESLVTSVSKRIRRIDGTTYDRCRDAYDKQYIAESIHSKLTECHRVVIFLTAEYINDQWSVYEAYEAWKNVIEFGTPIVFITFPSTKAAIEKLHLESRIAIKNALQRHDVIKWNGKLPVSRRMKMSLDLCLPKLPRDGATNFADVRCESGGSPSYTGGKVDKSTCTKEIPYANIFPNQV